VVIVIEIESEEVDELSIEPKIRVFERFVVADAYLPVVERRAGNAKL
jgi:hypothetical protein